MYLAGSVGESGKNNKSDVEFVQDALSILSGSYMQLPEVTIDGKTGPKTYAAIYAFQKHLVKLTCPDSKIDPSGRTEKTLIAKLIEIDKDLLPELSRKYKKAINKPKISGKGPRKITYRENAKKVVSIYSENIVKLAMAYAGINQCDFSSTIRTFDDQARIMMNNCKSFPSATSVASLRSARGWGYATAGAAVEEVFFQNKSKTDDEIKKALVNKIESLYSQGSKVSLHCVSESDYKNKNVIDIPYSSVAKSLRKNFEVALMGMSTEIKNARYTRPSPSETYIARLIIEDKCWHMEIPQTNKPLPNAKQPSAPVVSRDKPIKKSSSISHRDYFICFLDEWF